MRAGRGGHPFVEEGAAAVTFRFPEESSSAPFFAALRPADGVFGHSTRLTPRGAIAADVALGPGDAAVAAWTAKGGAVRVSFREAGGKWGPPRTLATHGADANAAIDSHGGALVVWTHPGHRMRSAARPPGGPWQPARDLPDPGVVQALELDAAGDALVLALRDGSARASYRPAGGSFGSDQLVADVRSYDRPRLAMNEAGDAVAAFPTVDGGVAESRRPAGGEFGPPVTVMAGPPPSGYVETASTVDDVALGGDGSAVVVWTVRTFSDDFGDTVRVLAADAPAGGSFGKPVRLSTPARPGYDAGTAIDASGDAVIAWGDPRFSVHAIYRPAGASFGAPLRLVGPRLGGVPDVSIDDGGRATAAWQQSDGEHVELVTRSFGPSGASTPAQVLKAAPAFRSLPHPRARCHPPRTRTLLETRYASVYRDLRRTYQIGLSSHYHPKYACLVRRGKPLALDYGFDDFPVTAAGPSSIALAGPLVAYVYFDEQCGPCGGIHGLTVMDLRTGRTANGFGPEGDPDPDAFDNGPIRRLVLRRDAALAYIQCFGTRRNHCHRRGVTSYVFKMDSGAARPARLAKGKGIDPRFLRLGHGRVTWRQGRRVRSAPLR